MTQMLSTPPPLVIRPAYYRDSEAIKRLCEEYGREGATHYSIGTEQECNAFEWRQLLGQLLKPRRNLFCATTEGSNGIQGVIRVSPFNCTRSTWRVDQIVVGQPDRPESRSAVSVVPLLSEVGSHLLRYCFETIWEARTWVLEVDASDQQQLALYRQNGFQPLAQMTYWEIPSARLQELAEREPDLPNLLPVSNADAQLLYQLDTVSMPPLVRQVFDRHVADFKTSLLRSLITGLKNWFSQTEVVSGYVFEPQRRAAIGYFQIQLYRDGSQPHRVELTVHPAYTWLYPELMTQIARIAQDFPEKPIQLVSPDYQPEREEYLERSGAERISHTLLMSRSVWHKLREAKPASLEGLQLPEVLQSLQPARKPVPGRVSVLHSDLQSIDPGSKRRPLKGSSFGRPCSSPDAGQRPVNLSSSTDLSEPPQEGPCC